MAFRYLKYRTDYGNTIIAESPTPFVLGPNEGQIFTSFEIPVIQPLYLYAESGGNVVVNSDSQINAWLASIGEAPFEVVFTGYTATTAQRLDEIDADLVYLSGQTALRLKTSDFNTYSGATQSQINGKLNTSAFNTYSGNTQSQINAKLNTSAFNTYSGNTQSQINGKLDTSDFDVYSAETLSLIQSSQAGLDPKQSVFVATVASLGGATYVPTGGTAGTGAFTSAPTTIDGRALSVGKRILVKNQADARQNGIYVVISSGVWHRSPDQNGTGSNISAGNYTFVETGTTNIGSGWVVIGNGNLVVNVDNIVWTQFNSSTGYVEGVGILITGNTINFDGGSVAGNALTWNGTQLNVDPNAGTLGTKFDTKLDKTTFNTYTGTTAPATYLTISNFNSYSAATLTNINSRLLTSAFNTYSANTQNQINAKLSTSAFNTYSANTQNQINAKLSTSAFNTYSGATLTNINSRLLTSAFNTYSGNTANLINTKVGSANNGLTKVGTNVRLGGSLTGATSIDATSFGLSLTGTSGQFNVGRTTGSINLQSRNAITLVGRSAANVDRTTLKISATGATFTDARTGTTAVGLQYGGDYTANYNLRSIPDVHYVTGNSLYTGKQILVYASGTTELNVTSAVNIPLNRLVRNDSSFYTYTGGTKIRILVAGKYDVWYAVTINCTTNNAPKSIATTLVRNGSNVLGTTVAGTVTQQGSAATMTLPPTEVVFAANDIVSLSGLRIIAGAGTSLTTANGVFLSIVKKN